MLAQNLFDRALSLLNYRQPDGNVDDTLTKNAIGCINAVYCDLFYLLNSSGYADITSLRDTLNLPERVFNDVAPYGVAMHLAQASGDGLNQQIFGTIYN
ncbi:MAG: hypothetical protein KBS41_00810, partial [Oscillospiraceae bacterium]|nr:hypothetical protein [Candidatus Equicaccousia limihippi]